MPWLFGIAGNVSLEARKARRRAGQHLVPEDDGDDREDLSTPAPEAELLGREAARVVDRALQRLSPDRRAALVLRLDHGLASDDIAAMLGWSLAKVKVNVPSCDEEPLSADDPARSGTRCGEADEIHDCASSHEDDGTNTCSGPREGEGD